MSGGRAKGTSALPGKRVLILVENLSVPFDRRVWQECQALRRAGYEVSVICPQGKGYDTEAYVRVDGVEIHRYPLEPATGGALGYVREYAAAIYHTARIARRLGRKRRYTVVHAANPPDFLLLAALTLRLRGAAFIFDHHDLVPELYLSRFGSRRDAAYWVLRLLERVALTAADAVLSTNESYRRVALERCGQPPDKVFVCRSAPAAEAFAAVPPDPALRRGKRYLLAYVGVMGPQDGVDHALRALAKLREAREDWHAIFVGAGDVYEEMVRLAADLGLSDLVEFTGRVQNETLIRVLSSADLGLSPDPKNPLNDVSTMNKVVEYMALGLPVVSYELTEARVSAGDAAAYAQPSDPGAFARAIAELLDDPARRERMSAIGRQRFQEKLSWKHSEQALLAAYARAQAHASGRAGIAEESPRGPATRPSVQQGTRDRVAA